jgi:phytoene dehydrogenase-like protein
MTARRTHIVGAGIAGLSAALAVTVDGGQTVLYEAAPHPGGRCRTLHPADGFDHDNGTHVLFTANGRALRPAIPAPTIWVRRAVMRASWRG